VALARVTTWNSGDTLTAAALNGEFNNILNNAIALVSPWTAAMDANNKQLQNHVLEKLAAAQTAATEARVYYRTDNDLVEYDTGSAIRSVPNFVESGGRLTLSGSNLLFAPYKHNLIPINGRLEVIPDAGVTLGIGAAAGSTAYNIYAYMSGSTMTLEFSTTATAVQAGTGVTIKSGDATRTFVGTDTTTSGPAWSTPVSFFNAASADPLTLTTAASSPPAANTLYKDNIPKVWATVSYTTGTPGADDSFNVSGIVDGGVGVTTVTIDTDMANTNYCAIAGVNTDPNGGVIGINARNVGSVQTASRASTGGATADVNFTIAVYGDQ